MAGLVPIQHGSSTTGQAGPLASSDGPAIGFAAVLSGVFDLATGAKTPFEATKLSDPGILDPGNGLTSPTAAAIKSSELWPVKFEGGSETPQSAAAIPSAVGTLNAGEAAEMPSSVGVKSSHSGFPVTPVPGFARTPNASSVDGMARSPGGTLLLPGASGSGGEGTSGDDIGLGLDHPGLDDNVQTPPEDANSVTALLAEAGLTMPFGITPDDGPHDGTEALVSPIAAAGNKAAGGGGVQPKGHRLPGEHSVPVDRAQAGHGVPDGALAGVGPVPQSQAGTVSATLTISTAASSATAPPITIGGPDKPANPHRPDPVDPGNVQPHSVAHPAEGASPLALSPIAAEPEKFVVNSDTVPEAAALAMRTEVPQASPSETASSPLRADHAQPAAPADQIAPALVGILQKSDGQQSVTIRLQPAELGQVQIRVDQTVAGAAHIDITAARPETLQMLQRDEPRLQQVLDQAGVLSTGRTISFQVSAQEQIGATASRPDSMETGAGASGQGQNGGAWRQNGDSPNDFGRNPDPDRGQSRPRWFRAGLDITA